MLLKELGFTLAEIALMLSSRDQGEINEHKLQSMAANVLLTIDQRIAALRVIRSYVTPVAQGDMSTLHDEDCSFLVDFMTALSVDKVR